VLPPPSVTPAKAGVQRAAAGSAGELAETAPAVALDARLREHDTPTLFSVTPWFREGHNVGWAAP
jgi:hypothetical protein